jgi:hypothetical protein
VLLSKIDYKCDAQSLTNRFQWAKRICTICSHQSLSVLSIHILLICFIWNDFSLKKIFTGYKQNRNALILLTAWGTDVFSLSKPLQMDFSEKNVVWNKFVFYCRKILHVTYLVSLSLIWMLTCLMTSSGKQFKKCSIHGQPKNSISSFKCNSTRFWALSSDVVPKPHLKTHFEDFNVWSKNYNIGKC